MTTIDLPKKSVPGSTEGVRFTDGMIVTAEDLTVATRYPLSLMQVLVRAYFGCGIVCGLDLTADRLAEKGRDDKCEDDGEGSFIVRIARGTALDCHGFPIALCKEVRFDLTPDPCLCGPPPDELCIAIRLQTASEPSGSGCGCGNGEGQHQCARVRDHVLIQAFPPGALPANTCRRSEPEQRANCDEDEAADERARADLCACLQACPDCDCCGDAWVLIGCVKLTENGVASIDASGRRWVKPTECHCRDERRQQDVDEPPRASENDSDKSVEAERSALMQEVVRLNERLQLVERVAEDTAASAEKAREEARAMQERFEQALSEFKPSPAPSKSAPAKSERTSAAKKAAEREAEDKAAKDKAAREKEADGREGDADK